jgi:hypothetical protein
MAVTRLTDVIYGPLFIPTVLQAISTGSAIRQSGIASADAEIQEFANAPGNILQMPYWNDISGASNVSSDDPSQTATPNKLTQGQDYARKIRRNNGWSAANLVTSILGGDDPLDIVAQRIAAYWIREEETVLTYVLNGVFAAASMSGHILAVASEAGATTPVNMDAEVSSNAHALLGQDGIQLRAVLMHSRVFWNLRAAGAIDFGENPAGVRDLDMPFWDGKRVLVSDAVPKVAGSTSGFKYTSYFFADGALGYAEATGGGGPKKPVELDPAPSAGNGEGVDTVWYRRHWIMHPRGVKFTSSSVAGESPTNAELATAANWVRVYDVNNVRIVAVTTNG